MQLNVMLEGQLDLSYGDLLDVARQAEDLGFAGLYRSDHYATPRPERPQRSTDAWATLAGLARETERILLGTLVSPATFRPAANLAKVVATVAEMAGTVEGRSRVELGMGTGWMASEHHHYGFPFPDIAVRYERLDEHLQVVRGLWDPEQDPFSFAGVHEQLEQARFRPVPDPAPRILVGGRGLRRTPALAARYADELNAVHVDVERCRAIRAALDAACAELGRDPADVGYSLMTGLIVGTTDREVRRRAERLLELTGDGRSPDQLLDEVRASWIVGTPEEAAERIAAYRDVGVQRVMLQHFVPADRDVLELVATEVLPRL